MVKNRLIALLLVAIPFAVMAEEKAGVEEKVKTLSGMAVMGNNEAPKALTIVPWKTSEGAMQTRLNSTLLDEGMSAVDKEVFMRQLDFHEISKAE